MLEQAHTRSEYLLDLLLLSSGGLHVAVSPGRPTSISTSHSLHATPAEGMTTLLAPPFTAACKDGRWGGLSFILVSFTNQGALEVQLSDASALGCTLMHRSLPSLGLFQVTYCAASVTSLCNNLTAATEPFKLGLEVQAHR